MSGRETTLTKRVRVWEDVHALYKDLSRDLGVIMSDLVSSALLELLMENPYFLAHIATIWFDLDYTKALKVVEKYRDRAAAVVKRYSEVVERGEG